MKVKEESIRLIIFLLALIVTTSLFTSLRIKDSYYLLSDSGIKKSDLQSKIVQRNFFDVFQDNIKSLLRWIKTNINRSIINNLK
jgi:archaellum component FlaG (FlaF/FlaG flagellin family)